MVKDRVRLNSEPSSPENKRLEPYQTRYRWVMLALVWLLYCVFGVVSRSLAPLVTPIIEDLNISYSQMGIVLGSWPLTYIVISIIGGALIDRWGIRRSLFLGIAIIGLSAVLRYFANGFATLFLMVALFGLGGPMISIGSPKTVAVWFRGKARGTAVAVYGTGSRIGALIAYSMTNSVVMPLTGHSWRLSFVCYGLLAFATALLWWFLARDVKTTGPTGATDGDGIAGVFTRLISIRNIRLILIIGFLSFSVSHGFNDWLPKILETGGLPPSTAGFAASLPHLVGMPLSLVILRVTPPHLRGRIVALAAFALAISLSIAATTSGAPLIAGLVFYGAAYVAHTPLLILFLMDLPEVGPKYMGSATGMYFCVAEIGGFVGPMIMGVLVDLTGNFLSGAILLAGLSLAASVMALFLKTSPASDTNGELASRGGK